MLIEACRGDDHVTVICKVKQN